MKLRIRSSLALLCVSAVSLGAGALAAAPAEALTIPTAGAVACDTAGTIKVSRVNPARGAVRVSLSAALSNCTFNGNPLPGASGKIGTVFTKKTAAAACQALTDGGTVSRTGVVIKAKGRQLPAVSVSATMTAPVASGSGSEFTISGSLSAPVLTTSVAASFLTASPVTDLCSGNASVDFTGSLNVTWALNF